MSLFHPMNLTCPNCEATITFEAVGSVNADRRPDFREAILEDTFQNVTCESCEHEFRLQPEFNYLDVGNRLWISSMPAYEMLNYLEIEDSTEALFDASYGAHAPQAAQDVGNDLDVRLTFGWPAVREKLLARVSGLDDVVIEMTKLDILRRVPDAPLSVGVELRLVHVEEDSLVFTWVRTDTEETLRELTVARALYDGIVENPDGWAAIRAQLTNGPFVDMQKLYLGEGRKAG